MKHMLYLILYIALFFGYSFADVNLWDEVSFYTIVNTTKEVMEITWVSGGGHKDVQTGQTGSFILAALSSNTIKTSNSDCLDSISVKGLTSSQIATLNSVCKTEITIKYKGDVKNQKLVLEA